MFAVSLCWLFGSTSRIPRARRRQWTDKYFVLLAILIPPKHNDKVPKDLQRHLAHICKVRIIICVGEAYLSRSERALAFALSRILRSVHDRWGLGRIASFHNKIPLVSDPTA